MPWQAFRGRRDRAGSQLAQGMEGRFCRGIALDRVALRPRRAATIDAAAFENYMADHILANVNRTSMLNSLEVRAPPLDYRLIVT